MLMLPHSNRRYSFVNVVGSVMPPDLGLIASKPPVGVIQSDAPALQPQSQENSIAADLMHTEPALELYETTQAEQYALDCDTKGEDTQSTTSPLEHSSTPKYRKDTEPEAIPLPPETRLKTEQHIRQLESQYKQADTTIRQLQIQQATLKTTIETCKLSLTPEPRQTRTKPIFTEMNLTPEATVPANDSEEYGAGSSASASYSGNTTMVEHDDDLDKVVSNDESSFCDPMDINSHDTEVQTSTFTRDVATQPMGAPEPQLSKRPNPHADINSPSKRKRLSIFSSKRHLFTPTEHQITDNLETKAEHAEKARSPITIHRLGENRLSQALHLEQHTQRDPEEGLMVINSSRPQSYPLTSLLRRSAVLSVKAIIEAFENLHLASDSATSS